MTAGREGCSEFLIREKDMSNPWPCLLLSLAIGTDDSRNVEGC